MSFSFFALLTGVIVAPVSGAYVSATWQERWRYAAFWPMVLVLVIGVAALAFGFLGVIAEEESCVPDQSRMAGVCVPREEDG
jgi:hypothetical protein